MQRIKIDSKLDGLNEYTAECRSNKYGGGACKVKNEKIIRAAIRKSRVKPIKGTYYVKFIWYEATKRRDKDNVAFAKKFILDALQKERITEGDSNRYLLGFSDEFVYGKGQSVTVELSKDENR